VLSAVQQLANTKRPYLGQPVHRVSFVQHFMYLQSGRAERLALRGQGVGEKVFMTTTMQVNLKFQQVNLT